MALKFKELRNYLSRNSRLSISFEDGHYDNYLILSDIPDEKYDDMYVFGIGKAYVEFTKDIYKKPDLNFSVKDAELRPALEIVLYDKPRADVGERKYQDSLRFGDLRKYLQVFGHMLLVMRNDWSGEVFDKIADIPDSYNEFFVYGIDIEDDSDIDKSFKIRGNENTYTKRMVVVLSEVKKYYS